MPLCEACTALIIDEYDNACFGEYTSPIIETYGNACLGEYKSLISKAPSCEACDFFTSILKTSHGWKTRLDELQETVVFLKGLRLDARLPNGLGTSSYILDELCFDQCVGEGVEDEELDSVRRIPVYSGDDSCLEKIQGWMGECATGPGHGACKAGEEVVLPERVIEVPSDSTLPPRISLSDGEVGRYVVLSYCSEESPHSSSSTSPGALDINSLHKAVADAISVARRLGYTYLWTKDLCMLGNLEPSAYIPIYAQADLMLSASCPDPASGLLIDRNVRYSPALGEHKNRYLRQTLLRWESDLEISALEQRGWPGVERMLAPRIVHFGEHQMIWECVGGMRYEASQHKNNEIGSGQVRMKYEKGVVQPYIKAAVAKAKDKKALDADADTQPTDIILQGRNPRLEAWLKCIEEFSSRSLNAPSKLTTMAPLACALDDGSKGEYLAGIWSKHIAYGLAWSRTCDLLIAQPECTAPSWSWASVDGPITLLGLSWPEDMEQEHAKDPTWLQTYQPHLLSHKMLLEDPDRPYGPVLKGSYIEVSGSCTALSNLNASVLGDLNVILVLDQSPAFDCQCCSGRSDEMQEKVMAELDWKPEHHICMVLQGDAWRVGTEWDSSRGVCDVLILKATGEEGCFTRAGLVRFQCDDADEGEAFDKLGWERRVVKLF